MLESTDTWFILFCLKLSIVWLWVWNMAEEEFCIREQKTVVAELKSRVWDARIDWPILKTLPIPPTVQVNKANNVVVNVPTSSDRRVLAELDQLWPSGHLLFE